MAFLFKAYLNNRGGRMIDGKYADYKGETYKVVEIISQEVVLVHTYHLSSYHPYYSNML